MRTSVGRLPVVFERLEGEVNSVVSDSDVLGRAGLKSPGLGWAFVGLGLNGLQAQPKPTEWAGLGLAWAWARACILILMFLPV